MKFKKSNGTRKSCWRNKVSILQFDLFHEMTSLISESCELKNYLPNETVLFTSFIVAVDAEWIQGKSHRKHFRRQSNNWREMTLDFKWCKIKIIKSKSIEFAHYVNKFQLVREILYFARRHSHSGQWPIVRCTQTTSSLLLLYFFNNYLLFNELKRNV